AMSSTLRTPRSPAVGDTAPVTIPPAASEENAGSNEPFFFEGVESPNGTIFPDVLLDRVMPHLSGAEFKVLAYVVRRTFGFKKESDSISLDQICNGITRRDGSVLDEGTGLARKTAVAAIQGLEGKGVILCQRRSSPEKGNLPTTFALRFRGQATNGPDTFPHQGGGEMYPGGGEKQHQASYLAPTAPGTVRHSQPTVVQPTVKQVRDNSSEKSKRTVRASKLEAETIAHATNAQQAIEATWQQVLDRLAETIGAVSHRTWLAPTRLQAIDTNTARVEVPHALAQRWIERHLRDAITTELGAVTGRPLTVQFVAATPNVVLNQSTASTTPAARPIPLVGVPAVEPAERAPVSALYSRRGGVIRRVRRDGTG
ncbi:MAG TPA: DnaA N-terminal domain-containing protein, partial [Chloroflexota bacterium]